MGVIPEERPWCRRGGVPVWSAHAGASLRDGDRVAEHIVPAEAAPRPQDRAFFDGQNRREHCLDLSVAAPLNSTVRRPGSVVTIPFSTW